MKYSYTTYFAEIYDEIMVNVPYKYWFRYLKDLLKYYQLQPQSILELASGTSNMTFEMINLNSVNKITALDLSAAMISKAAEKLENLTYNSKKIKEITVLEAEKEYQIIKNNTESAELKINFSRQNMAEFVFEEKFSLIVSFFDSLNYLTDLNQLQSAFDQAAAVLSEEGLFIFDMNSIGRINEIEEGSLLFEGDNYQCFWEDIVYPQKNIWQVKLKICPDNEQLPCFEELHSERGYKIKTILRLLKNSGFKAIDTYNAFSFAEGKNNSRRLYFVAALKEERLEKGENKIKKIFYGLKNRIDYLLVSLKW